MPLRPDTFKPLPDELKALLDSAKGREMTPAERFEQKVSWVYGNLPEESTVTKDEVRQRLRESGDA